MAVSPTRSTGHPSRYEIPFLDDDGSNFTFWKYHIQMVFGLRDLWPMASSMVPELDRLIGGCTYSPRPPRYH
ncbi:hypothetical protein BJV78DRAFT_1271576 [Lactifluus subvellereus]|nr:hypothetical protein BJV78DRAFT_1271576 [Lactifluus subvellereus]